MSQNIVGRSTAERRFLCLDMGDWIMLIGGIAFVALLTLLG
jgi:hypothetical protein